MSRGLSVVVVVDGAPELTRLMRSVDEQRLPVDEFEMVILDRGLTEQARTRLRDLAGRRPNLVLLGRSDTLAGRLADLVVLVAPGSRLYPDALQHLLAGARTTGVDVLVGRSVFPELPLTRPFLDDVAVESVGDRERALRAPVMIVGREWVDLDTGKLVAETSRAAIRTLTRHPISEEQGSGGTPVPGTPVVTDVSTGWSDAVLEVRCAGTWADVVPGEGDRLVAVLRRLGTSLSYIADADDTVRTDGWSIVVRVDPRLAAAGNTLPTGIFEIDLILAREGGSTVPVAVPSGGRSGLVSEHVSVVVDTGAVSGRLQIDVGPAYFPFLHEVDPHDVSVVESSVGSVMTIALPFAAGADVSLPARLGLGSLRVPARVDCRAGKASFTAFVSGLCGDAEINGQFGHSRFQPSGVSLLIDGVGAMSAVRTTSLAAVSPSRTQLTSSAGLPRPLPVSASPSTASPSPPPPAAPVPPATKPVSVPPPPTGAGRDRTAAPVARLRRALPARVQRLARAAGRRGWVRRIYRSLPRWTR